MSAHAILSPSGASRWLQCTPSARLEFRTEDKPNDAADEGTAAHRLAEVLLRKRFHLFRTDYEYLSALQRATSSKYYCAEMQSYIDEYVNYVEECYNEFGREAQIFFEVRLDLSSWIPDGFGTGDVVIVADGIAHLIDLKYGKGVAVSAINNRQLMVYGLGVYHHFDLLYAFNRIRLTIYQPRTDSITTDEFVLHDLLDWAEQELKPKAALAYAGEGEFVTGPHCQFCRVAHQCRALAEENQRLARLEFAFITDTETVEILQAAERFRSWLKAVETNALSEAIRGKKWPGLKVVEGRSNRSWVNTDKTIAVLRALGYSDDKIFHPAEIFSPAQVEKNIGKKQAKQLVGLSVKPRGKPALVADTDKRPVFVSAQVDFADYAETEDAPDDV